LPEDGREMPGGHRKGERAARRRPGGGICRVRVSPTLLKTYERCPRQYKFIYIDHLRPQFERARPELFAGQQIHSALKTFFDLEPAARTLPVLQDQLRTVWGRDRRRAEAFADRELERQWGLRSLAMLEWFCDTQDLEAQPVLLEQFVEHPLDDTIILSGRIDRVDETPEGDWVLWDYKTGRKAPDPDELRADLQTGIYRAAVEGRFGRKVSRIIYLYLQPGARLELDLEPGDVQAALDNVRRLVEFIRGDEAFEPQPNPLCRNYCDFLPICPLKQDIAG